VINAGKGECIFDLTQQRGVAGSVGFGSEKDIGGFFGVTVFGEEISAGEKKGSDEMIQRT
jgi:hypothetical protein